MQRYLPIVLAAAVAVAVVIGSAIRDQLGVEFAPESLRTYFLGLGPMAPAIFVAIMAFRSFLLLPSILVLSVGGLAFGAAFGTALGALGIVLSGSMMFGVARGIGRDWVRRYLGSRFEGVEKRVGTAGPWLIGLSTAHPMGPMSPLHWAAGLSSIRVERFILALALAGVARAAACSYFGSSLLDVGSRDFYLSTGLLLGVVVIPVLHPGIRAKIFAASVETSPPTDDRR